MKLIVTHAFGDFARGAEITDPDAADQARKEHPEKVVQVADAPKIFAKE